MSAAISSAQLKTFTLQNQSGIKLAVTNFGGKVISLWVPDRKGNLADIVLGYDQAEQYLNGKPHFGALIGRFANRIANGSFHLNGITYHLAKNNGPNSLHGGPDGFHNVLWQTEPMNKQEGSGLTLTYQSADGEEGFPGTMDVTVTYLLTEGNELIIDYEATTSKTTVINMTHHSFFNLAGEGSPDVLDHELLINAEYITALNDHQIPTGELLKVEGTPFDFRQFKSIRKDIEAESEQIQFGQGYDHNWVLKEGNGLSLAAIVREPASGRLMEVWTTQPGMQFYSSNFLNNDIGKGGKVYLRRSALCLEAQHFPDSPNHPHFPSTTLQPGEHYKHRTVYKFMTY